MKHLASPEFWEAYRRLPTTIQRLSDKNFKILKSHPKHPSLHLKKIGRFRSVRVGIHYRPLAVETGAGDLLWFWIGSHAEYDQLLRK